MVYLENVLPAGSHVVFIGLLDRSFWWDTLNAQEPPLIGHGVTSARFWNRRSCWHTNPCEGWLNSQETTRAFTTARAKRLNEEYEMIVQNFNFRNFEMHYMPYPLDLILEEWGLGADKLQILISKKGRAKRERERERERER
jgi:acyloxyacyl hydrolase